VVSKLVKFDESTSINMRRIGYFFVLMICLTTLNSCSKCYDCVETQNVIDSQGNVIDQTEVHENVCTSDQDEIARREQNGAVCSK
jgi:outer membrane protein assembly factor BamE (lipoprotein component of BamABCDE complex)